MLSIILLLTGLINFRIVMYCGNITHMYIHVLLSVVKGIVKKKLSHALMTFFAENCAHVHTCSDMYGYTYYSLSMYNCCTRSVHVHCCSSAEMTCAEMHKLYFEMKDRVFKNPSFGLACNTEELERILKKTFSDKRMNHRHKPK